MNDDEKRARIKRLWIKASLVVYFTKMKKKSNDDNLKMINDSDSDIDLDQINGKSEQKWKWYIVRTDNTLPKMWNFLMKSLTIYTMFAIPFVLVFTEAHKSINLFEFCVDVCFLIDTFLNFFKLGPD